MSLLRSAVGALFAALFCFACTPPAAATPPSATPTSPPRAPSASSTPTVRPTVTVPTATLPPAPHSFTEGFDADAPYWTFLQAGAGEQQLSHGAQGGALRLDMPAPDMWAYALYVGPTYEDVRIDAVVDLAGGSGSAGLICRYDPLQGWYEFNIQADGTYSILFGQWLAEGIARYTPLVVSTAEQIAPGTNEIGLACEGNILTPYINTVQVRRRQETQHLLSRGQVGVSAASAQAAVQTILFDWISVGSP